MGCICVEYLTGLPFSPVPGGSGSTSAPPVLSVVSDEHADITSVVLRIRTVRAMNFIVHPAGCMVLVTWSSWLHGPMGLRRNAPLNRYHTQLTGYTKMDQKEPFDGAIPSTPLSSGKHTGHRACFRGVFPGAPREWCPCTIHTFHTIHCRSPPEQFLSSEGVSPDDFSPHLICSGLESLPSA